jgi:hypothetical protein
MVSSHLVDRHCSKCPLMRSITCLTRISAEAPARVPNDLAFKLLLLELAGVIDHVGFGAQPGQLSQPAAVGATGLPTMRTRPAG